MNLKIKNIISVIASILLITGITTSIGAFLERNFIILSIDFILIVIGVILLSIVFGD